MSKLWLYLLKKSASKNEGFSLFEVLVAIMVSAAFVMGTLQAMAINAVLQVKAERESQANFWIQQDMEMVQAVAANKDAIPNSSNYCTKTDPNDRFGEQLIKILNSTIYSESATPNISLQAYKADANGNTVFKTDKTADWVNINYSGTTTQKKATVQKVGDQKLVNKNYRLVRILATDNTTNYDVAQITYRIGEPYDSTNPKQTDVDQDQLADDTQRKTSIVVKNYAEVIPAAVNECKL